MSPGISSTHHDACAFGLHLSSAFPLPGEWPTTGDDTLPRVAIERASLKDLRAELGVGMLRTEWQSLFPDGNAVTVQRADEGAYRFQYGEIGEFVLSADRGRIYGHGDDGNPRWMRFLLDTVLWWTALAHGYHVLHASAVEGPDGIVVFAGQTGGGKTTLALELLDRGWKLCSDDIVVLQPGEGRPLVHPGPPLMNAPREHGALDAHGTALASIDGEVWLSVARTTEEPRELAAVFLYSRGPGLALATDDAAPNVLDLVPHVWDIHVGHDRLRERFALLSDIVDRAPVVQLSASLFEPPAAIADAVESVVLARASHP